MNLRKGLVIALIACGVTVSAAQGKPLTREEELDLSAVVESVDQATRTVVLVGDTGQRGVFVAGPEITNLKDVKAGDRVRLTYKIAVAAAVKPRGTPAAAPTEDTIEERSAPGKPPHVAAGRTVLTTVKIDSVDTSFHTVTFKRADGITRVVGVDDPQAQRFIRTLKPGDSVEISYSEAVAVSVERVAAN
jgi:hypothetical protein